MTTAAPTSSTAPVDFVLTTIKEKRKASEVSPKEIMYMLDTPPVVHEIVAILRFGTSYELV